MPITRSAGKALRQNIRRRTRNAARFRSIREKKREIRNLIVSGKKEEAKKLLPSFYKLVDKAAKNDTLKKNAASRLKSKLTKAIGR